MLQLLPKDCVNILEEKKPLMAFEVERKGMLTDLSKKRRGL